MWGLDVVVRILLGCFLIEIMFMLLLSVSYILKNRIDQTTNPNRVFDILLYIQGKTTKLICGGVH